MPKNLIETVLNTIRNYDMLKPGDTVAVAVSGGPDSVFLLYALAHLKGKVGIKKLIVCNMDHGLRGADSKEDSLFVKNLAKRLGLEFIHKKVNLNKPGSKGLSTEELARQARYGFLKDCAKEKRVRVIATGHTLDDQAETVLMRIIKGSSLKGAAGISPAREERGVSIIRPLLELEKAEIEKFLRRKNIGYRIDRTNLEPLYFRNIVRLKIIPFLERYNPRLKRVLFNLAEHLREDFEFIRSEKLKAAKYIAGGKQGTVRIKLKDIVIQPKALQKEILRDALDKAGGEVKRLSFRHWKEMEGLIMRKRGASSVDLPGSVRISRSGKYLSLGRI